MDIHETLAWIHETTALPMERIARLFGVSRQTLHAWRRGEPISDTNRRNLLAVYDILTRAVKNCRQREDLLVWLDAPRGSDARSAAQLMGRGEYDRARNLSLVASTAAVRPLPDWARADVPSRFRPAAFMRQNALLPAADSDDPPLDSTDSGDDH